ncbi:uncharacterized protein LOC114718199 isoform X2 [Neltuma alba]|uniref:uncharacterized protein LOC114718199 isoform X2 n=1 Tax=Neltuma alba TaxID=207710 RepID=UPI0010A43641|nr:uncharacterized protein LOC114718199 isoform X2 [Prosopis alba]
MASIHYSVSIHSVPKLPKSNNGRTFSLNLANPKRSCSFPRIRASSSQSSPSVEEAVMSIDNLHSFIELNMGKWNGSFYQFDASGHLLQQISTKLSASSYGEDHLMSLIQTNVKLPSRRPSVVCESCLYSLQAEMRARAFHILDPKGVVDMLIVFLEEKSDGSPPLLDNSMDKESKILPFLGEWKGHSVTKRSGVYGSTIAEADTVVSLEMDDDGQLNQVVTSTSNKENANVTTNVEWKGTMSENLVTFDGGYQVTLLPGGMYMGCPCDVSKSVAESKSFHLEFCWLETPNKRQRLVRTYDVQGLAVSSTYFFETKS